MLCLAMAWLVTAGGGADLKVSEIQVYTFDRKSGEMAPIDERARPMDWAGDLITIVRHHGVASETRLNVKVYEGKHKRLDETRTIGDTMGNYELFFVRAGKLCDKTTITVTMSKGRSKSSTSTTRQFGCEE